MVGIFSLVDKGVKPRGKCLCISPREDGEPTLDALTQLTKDAV